MFFYANNRPFEYICRYNQVFTDKFSGIMLPMRQLLFVDWHVSPILFHIGNYGIRWYSILFVSGFVLGWFLFKWFFRRERIDLALLDPLLYTLLAATIVGARLGHCIFYDSAYYFGSWSGFLEVFMPWKGGLASHGGAIALLLAMWWFAHRYGRKYGFDFIWMLDRLCITVAFAGCLIRLGNLFNSEIYGHATSLPWGFIFRLRGETVPKHPTQIYEALSYLILGLIMLAVYKYRLDKVRNGFFFGFFLVGCFGMRFLIEFVKEASLTYDFLGVTFTIGQVLSVPFILAGIGLLIYSFVTGAPARTAEPSSPAKKR